MKKLRIRPHHLFCGRFLNFELPDRGEAFEKAEREVREVFKNDPACRVQVIEGPDMICSGCPDLKDGRCASALGAEEAVRKWDGHIIRGLGISYDDEKTTGEWLTWIENKAPLPFCETKCQWKTICAVFKGDAPA
jgi:hypothetical protein